jgi:hypothetical protein
MGTTFKTGFYYLKSGLYRRLGGEMLFYNGKDSDAYNPSVVFNHRLVKTSTKRSADVENDL